MKFMFPLLLLLALSAAASASTDIFGKFGSSTGFTGRFPIVGGIGPGGSTPPTGCAGVIDASAGCPLPMLGM